MVISVLALSLTGCKPSGRPWKPSDLTATGTSYREIILAWRDNSDNEKEFRIYCSYFEISSFQLIGVASANSTSAIHSGLNPLTDYFFYVEAYNSAGTSPRSNTAKGTTLSGVDLLSYTLGEKYGDACITGQARNITSEMLNSVTVTAWFYDPADILLDTSSEREFGVSAATTWNFEIRAFAVPFGSVARYDIEVTDVNIY